MWNDPVTYDLTTLGLVGGVLLVLGAATALVHLLKTRTDSDLNTAMIESFRRRIRAWWILCTMLAAAFLLGQTVTVIVFGLISFWALREFITLTPTRPGDHRALFWVFFLLTPLQFVSVGLRSDAPCPGYRDVMDCAAGTLSEGKSDEILSHLAGCSACRTTLEAVDQVDPENSYSIEIPKHSLWRRILNRLGSFEFFSIMIPVYGFLFVLARVALAGDYKRFLERAAKIQAGLLICVYCLSHAPAILTLNLSGWSEKVRLLFFFVLMVQLSDALQYAWARIPSKHPIVPTITPNKTWEGLLGGTLSVVLIGAALWWATPFQDSYWWLAGLMSGVISLMSFAGAITLSAIKRDRGVKDYGTLVEGHGGVLDRVDSICFAAPVFYHLTRWWLGT